MRLIFPPLVWKAITIMACRLSVRPGIPGLNFPLESEFHFISLVSRESVVRHASIVLFSCPHLILSVSYQLNNNLMNQFLPTKNYG